MSAAAQALVVSLIIFALLQRTVHLGENEAYLSLERAALVENLDSREIRTRFVTQLLGPEIGEWLRGMGPRLVEADDKLKQAVSAAKTQLTDIESIDNQYSMERAGRAQRVTEDLNARLGEHKAALEKFVLDLQEYVRIGVTEEEVEMLKGTVSQLKSSATGWKEHVEAANGLVAALKRFLPPDSPAKR